LPHAEQFAGSLSVSMHAPSHNPKPGEQSSVQ
jgi:hypothetical protein